jgi:hypothetical protein
MDYAQLKEIVSTGDKASYEEQRAAVDYALFVFDENVKIAKKRGLPLARSLAGLVPKDELRLLFDTVKLCQCCSRHMSSVPVAIDSDELTPPFDGWYRDCKSKTRHAARFFKRAYDFDFDDYYQRRIPAI